MLSRYWLGEPHKTRPDGQLTPAMLVLLLTLNDHCRRIALIAHMLGFQLIKAVGSARIRWGA